MILESIHPNGPFLSRIIAGAWRWRLEPLEIERLIQRALENGITSFDHADIYGDYSNEELFGRVLKQHFDLRQRMQIITKCGIKLLSARKPGHWIKHYDTSKEHIIKSAENSLRDLSTDRIDLLLIHRPDPLMDPEEVAGAFELLKQQGKVLHFGVSNFTVSQFEMLQQFVSFPLVTNQIELSLFRHDPFFDGTVDWLIKNQITPMAWSPLGGGEYFGNEIMNQLETMSKKYNYTTTQLLLAWLLHHPSKIFPIIGTTNPDRIHESALAVNIQLEKQDWFQMLKWVMGKDLP